MVLKLYNLLKTTRKDSCGSGGYFEKIRMKIYKYRMTRIINIKFLFPILLVLVSCSKVQNLDKFELKGSVKRVLINGNGIHCKNSPHNETQKIIEFNRDGSIVREEIKSIKNKKKTTRIYNYHFFNLDYQVEEYVNDSLTGTEYYYIKSERIDSVIYKDNNDILVMKGIYTYSVNKSVLKMYDSDNRLIYEEETYGYDEGQKIYQNIVAYGYVIKKTFIKDLHNNVIKGSVERSFDNDIEVNFKLEYDERNNWINKFVLCNDSAFLFEKREIIYW